MKPPFRRFVGRCYRAHHPRWSFAPESGDGAKRHGGRFNPPGVAALYMSLSVKTAWLEAQQGFVFKAQPLTLCAYEVDCVDMINLADEETRAAADAPLADLACPWEDLADRRTTPPSWAIAERLRKAGCAGIMVPSFASSARESDFNLVFWRWSREPPHLLRVIDDEDRLPKNDASWR